MNSKLTVFFLPVLCALLVFGQNCSETSLRLPNSLGKVSSDGLAISFNLGGGNSVPYGQSVEIQLSGNVPGQEITWYLDGKMIDGENGDRLTIEKANYDYAGEYHAVVSQSETNRLDLVVETATSCMAIRTADPNALADGEYMIDPDGSAGPLPVYSAFCDMTTNGGGFTRISVADARLIYGGAFKAAMTSGGTVADFDAENRPYTRDTGGAHVYHYDFQLPFGYQSFYLKDYVVRANGNDPSDLNQSFKQTDWNVGFGGQGPNGNPVGDISFGSPAAAGPTTSYGAQQVTRECLNCDIAWPANGTVFTNAGTGTGFRIGMGEDGVQSEGWFPWYSGFIFVR